MQLKWRYLVFLLFIAIVLQNTSERVRAGGLNAPSTAIGTYTSSPNAPIADSLDIECDLTAGPATVDTITIPDTGAINDVNVVLDITHGYRGDVQILLTSPEGTTLEIVQSIDGFNNPRGSGMSCGSDWEDIVTTLDDESTNGSVENALSETMLANYQPAVPLSGFDGEDLNGNWTLTVYDWTESYDGTLNSWSLVIDYGNSPTDTPTNTFTPTNTPTNTFTPTNTPTNTFTATNTPTASFTASNTGNPVSATNTNTPSPTNAGGTATYTPSRTNTPCVRIATAPTLTAPTHRTHTTDTTPRFSWTTVNNAQSYRLMVYLEDRSFEYKKRVFVTNYTLTTVEALVPGQYLWRVRTQDKTCSTWSLWSKRNTLFVD